MIPFTDQITSAVIDLARAYEKASDDGKIWAEHQAKGKELMEACQKSSAALKAAHEKLKELVGPHLTRAKDGP